MTIKDISCPECDHRLKLGAHPHKGQRLICPSCETSLTVISLSPVELDLTMTVNQAVNTTNKPHTIEVPCPECEDTLRINPHTCQGYRVRCKSCDTILEVASTNPLELDVATTAKLDFSYRGTSDEEPRHPGKKAGRARR